MAATANRIGHTEMCSGLDLDVNDYVEHVGTWYRLVEQTDESRGAYGARVVRTRVFRGVAKDGSRRALLLDESKVKAYRWER
jgi:hypothetical protein